VGVRPDGGLIGYGRVCPLGPFYLARLCRGIRTGNPKNSVRIWDAVWKTTRTRVYLNTPHDSRFSKGHANVKTGNRISPVGACSQSPVGCRSCQLMAGGSAKKLRLYRAISQRSHTESNGRQRRQLSGSRITRRFQLKVGGDRRNTRHTSGITAVLRVLQSDDRPVPTRTQGWTASMRAMRSRSGRAKITMFISTTLPETYERMSRDPPATPDHPFVLDENIDSLEMLIASRSRI